MRGWGSWKGLKNGRRGYKKILIKSVLKSTIKSAFLNVMVNAIAANDLKIKGISLVEKLFQQFSEVFISVRGKEKYVILPKKEYEHLRKCELDAAYYEVMEDVKNGKYTKDTPEDHVAHIFS